MKVSRQTVDKKKQTKSRRFWSWYLMKNRKGRNSTEETETTFLVDGSDFLIDGSDYITDGV